MKRFLVLAVTLILAFSLTGCGKSPAPGGGGAPTPVPAPTVAPLPPTAVPPTPGKGTNKVCKFVNEEPGVGANYVGPCAVTSKCQQTGPNKYLGDPCFDK